MKNKIILSYPEKRVRNKVSSVAYGVLPIASALKEAGFDVEILDTRVQGYEHIDKDYLKDVLFVGISTMTGPQIAHGLNLSRHIKMHDRSVPVVWGGIHPTLLPIETAKSKYVDIVVRGEGEDTVVELAKRLKEKKEYDDVPGLAMFRGKTLIITEPACFVDLDKQGRPPYDMLDKRKYDFSDFVSYCSSRGCPSRCTFCFNQAFYNRKWHFRSMDKVIDDLKWLKAYTKCKRIGMVDDNFFVDKKRVEEFCDRLLKEKLNIKWSAMCRLNYFDNYSLDFLRKIKRAGCYELGLGAESGSQKILNLVKKDITVKQIIEGTKKCVKARIHPVISFMCGFPTETKEDVLATIDLIDNLRKIDEDVEINGYFIYTPYPGGELYELLGEKVKFPTTLEGWAKWDFSDQSIISWIDKKHLNYISTVSTIVRYQFLNPNLKKYARKHPLELKSILFFATNWFFELSSRLRWKTRFFSFPLEWKLWSLVNKKVRGEH